MVVLAWRDDCEFKIGEISRVHQHEKRDAASSTENKTRRRSRKLRDLGNKKKRRRMRIKGRKAQRGGDIRNPRDVAP